MSSAKTNTRGRNSAIYTYAALAVAAAGILYYLYQRSQPRDRRENRASGEEETTSEAERNETLRPIIPPSQSRPRRRPPVELPTLRHQRPQQQNRNVRTRKRSMSISLRNTLIWNSSNDPDSPNYAFIENIIPLLEILTRNYTIYLVSSIKTEKEKDQILSLFRDANFFIPNTIDERKVLFCEKDEGKVHIIRHLEASVHVEGDGSDVIDLVRGFVERVVWVKRDANSTIYTNRFFTKNDTIPSSTTSRNRPRTETRGSTSNTNSTTNNITTVDTSQWNNVEICSSLLTSSLNSDPLLMRRRR
ncbi:hypothetical protein G9A89_020574 [Geosiphon pyriformis]|nr:hypothetical protein G9A89_020574 [Geosiphon pyriformis]